MIRVERGKRHLHLWEGKKRWMSTDEHLFHEELWERASGHVLIAGLGMGFAVYPLLANPEVTSITIVEKSGEIIKYFSDSLYIAAASFRKEIQIKHRNIHDYIPCKRIDSLWLDIWVDRAHNQEAEELIRKLRPYCREGAWVGYW